MHGSPPPGLISREIKPCIYHLDVCLNSELHVWGASRSFSFRGHTGQAGYQVRRSRTCLLQEMLPVGPPPVRGARLLLRPAAVPLEAPVLLQLLQVAHVNVLVGHGPERGCPAAEGGCGHRSGCHAGLGPRLELHNPTPLTRGAESPASPNSENRGTPPGRRHLSLRSPKTPVGPRRRWPERSLRAPREAPPRGLQRLT